MKIAVRVNNWIGDVVMNLPALTLLRQAYPDAEIVAVARPWVASILQFRKDLVDRCIAFDDKGEAKSLGGFLRFCKSLRAERFDLGVVFTKHLKGALMMALARVPKRIGLKTGETSLFLNGGVAYKALPKSGRHQSLNYVDVVANGLGISSDDAPKPQLHRDSQSIEQVLKKFLGGNKHPLLCVHAGAAYGTAKRWSQDGYAAVVKRFLEERGGSALLLGVASEAEVNQHIETTVAHEGVINLCGKTTLAESLNLIAASDGFLSNDSGLMHVAGAFGRPQVAIFGPTDINATFPLNESAALVREAVSCSPCFKRHCPIGHDCMKQVEKGKVWQALDHVMPIE